MGQRGVEGPGDLGEEQALATLPEALVGDSVRLRRWTTDHVDELLDAIRVSLAELRLWLPFARDVPTVNDETDVLRESAARFDAAIDFEYFLFELATDELVGCAGLHVREAGLAEIGYWVRSDRHRRGYATDASRLLTSAGFACLPEVDLIEIRMDQANTASAGVPSRLGYTRTRSVERDIITPGHTGIGWVWTMRRADWQRAVGQPDAL